MMSTFKIPIQIRWSDIDQNRHLRHSVYYDYGALMRMTVLSECGLTTDKLEHLKIGPILFREEAIFKREITLEDKITMDVELLKATQDFSRWSLRHHVIKEGGTLAAVITVEGAWIDIEKRKLATPDNFIQSIFNQFPKPADFQWTVRAEKKSE